MIKMHSKKIDKITNIWINFFKGQVSYIPTLGPVYNFGSSIKKLLFDVLSNSQIEDFLPYDKNKRWFKDKKEKIIFSEIIVNDKEIFIPVRSNFRKNTLKIFYYTKNTINNLTIYKIKKIVSNLKNVGKINNFLLHCFKKPEIEMNFICHNVYLKIINKKDFISEFPENIDYYENLKNKIKQTFGDLEKESELEGFGFLWKDFINKNKSLSPIICAIKKEEIIGAIGPIDVLNDHQNVLYFLPPYFGIKEKLRGNGYGEKLWRAAINLAYQKGAKYTLVQNTPDSPAAHFYEKHGLIKSSEIFSVFITL